MCSVILEKHDVVAIFEKTYRGKYPVGRKKKVSFY